MQMRAFVTLGWAIGLLWISAPTARSQDGKVGGSLSVGGSFEVDGKAPGPKPRAQKAAPQSSSGGEKTYLAAVNQGLQRIVVRDGDAALGILRDAAAQEPNRPEAFCHMGDAQQIRGEKEEALKAYQSCARFANATNNAHYALLGQLGQALVLEQIPERREDAKALYQGMLNSSEEPARKLAKGRLAAMDAVRTVEEKYAPVRQRIKDRKAKKAAEAEGAKHKKGRKRR